MDGSMPTSCNDSNLLLHVTIVTLKTSTACPLNAWPSTFVSLLAFNDGNTNAHEDITARLQIRLAANYSFEICRDSARPSQVTANPVPGQVIAAAAGHIANSCNRCCGPNSYSEVIISFPLVLHLPPHCPLHKPGRSIFV